MNLLAYFTFETLRANLFKCSKKIWNPSKLGKIFFKKLAYIWRWNSSVQKIDANILDHWNLIPNKVHKVKIISKDKFTVVSQCVCVLFSSVCVKSINRPAVYFSFAQNVLMTFKNIHVKKEEIFSIGSKAFVGRSGLY